MKAAQVPGRRPVALRRSWLFTAGLDDAVQQAALRARPDVLVADLEEFTAPADRPAARARIVDLMASCRSHGVIGAVRINRLAGDGLADLHGVMPGAPDAIFLPHVQGADEIAALATALAAIERAANRAPGGTEIVPTVESALGLVRLQGILAASDRVQACLLAAEDLTADLGCERGPDSLELNPLRSRFHVECTAAGRVAIDCPYNYRHDAAALAADLAWARRTGLKAKCSVVPEQVAAIHAAFTPSGPALARARALVARHAAGERGDAGGDPLELPDLYTARRLLARAEAFQAWAQALAGPAAPDRVQP